MAEANRQWREYRTAAGARPIKDFILEQSAFDQARIYARMKLVAAVGLEAARHLRGDIWEVRVEGRNQAFRVLFAPEGRFGQVFLSLEAFSKKTQKTPKAKIELAEQRLAEWRARGKKKGAKG